MHDTIPAPEPVLYSINAIASTTGLGRTSLYAQIGSGRLRTVTVGRRRFATREQLAAFARLLEAEAASRDGGAVA